MLRPSYHSAHNPSAAKIPSLQEEPAHGLPTGNHGISAIAPPQGSSAQDKEYLPSPRTRFNAEKAATTLGLAGIDYKNVLKKFNIIISGKKEENVLILGLLTWTGLI